MAPEGKYTQSPRLAQRFLRSFLKETLLEEVLGDLDEKFYYTLKTKSLRKARRNYWVQVIRYFRPFALKKVHFSQTNHSAMFQHNLLISYRNLIKNKAHSFITIGGLAIGLIVTLMIGLWVDDELSFNKSHEHYDRIVQVLHQRERRGEMMTNTSQVTQLGPHLAENYPHFFERVVMTPWRPEEVLLSVGENSFNDFGRYMQEEGPEMLSLEMIYGTRAGLKEMNSIMLSETLAKKFFGNENPMDQIVKLRGRFDMRVTGVYKDIPKNSTFYNAHFIAPFKRYYNNDPSYFQWDNFNTAIYAQLKPNVDAEQVSAAIRETMFPHMGEFKPTAFVMPMKDWHLRSYYENGIKKTSPRLQFVWLYSVIGGFVLLLACINFMNLSTARSEKRMKEVGIRKAIGSRRNQLIRQFLSESILYTIAAFLLSIGATVLALPWFNQVAEKQLEIPFESSQFWVISVGFLVLTSLLAGLYPAFYLSSFKPVNALKGQTGVRGKARLRQVLVVFQFTISIMLIIGTVTIHSQTQFAKNRPVGYSQEGLIMMRAQNQEYVGKFETLQTELKKTGMVTEIAQANYPLINTFGQNGGFDWTGLPEEREVTFNTIFVRPEYGKTVGWEMLQGRDFDRSLASDMKNGVIISESAAEIMGLENPIGHKIRAKDGFNGKTEYTILGIATDMIKGSPFEAPVPAIIFPMDADMLWMLIRVHPEVSMSAAIPVIQETWFSLAPTHPFHYEFVDDLYGRKFREEERISSLSTFFSLLAVLISCLGLYGLASFVAEQRTKEVGIRKVLGASIGSIWQLLSKDFTVLVLLASIIAIPVSRHFLSDWLDGYEYSIQLGWWIFALAAFSALVIALLIVSLQTVKAAISNPVRSLRSE